MIKTRTISLIIFPCGREVCRSNSHGRLEYKRRLRVMWEEQGKRCALGGEVMTLEDATYDHEYGRGMGGGKRDDRIRRHNGKPLNAAVCALHNGDKGSKVIEYVVKRT